jgi:carbon monoxide dehydrogenase subunit G
MIQHETSMHLNCTPAQVFPFLAEPQKLLLWQSELVKIEMVTDAPLRAGSRFHEVRRMGSREAEVRAEITDFDTDRCLATRTESKPEARVRYELEPEEGGTRLRYAFTLQTAGLMRLVEPMIGSSVRKGTEANFAKLRQLVES